MLQKILKTKSQNWSKLHHFCILNILKLVGRIEQLNYLPPRDRVIMESNNTSSGGSKKDSPTNVDTEIKVFILINAFLCNVFLYIFQWLNLAV